jgi:hypothetical protein
MKSPGITRNQILIRFHNADQLHVRPSGEAWNEAHRVIVIQPNHRKPHRRFCILSERMAGDKNEAKKYRKKFFHKKI